MIYQCFDRTFSPLIELFKVSFVLNTVGFCWRCSMSPCGYQSQNRKLFPLMQTRHKQRASYCRHLRCKITAISRSHLKDSSCEGAIGDLKVCRLPFGANQQCLFSLWGVQMDSPHGVKCQSSLSSSLFFPRQTAFHWGLPHRHESVFFAGGQNANDGKKNLLIPKNGDERMAVITTQRDTKKRSGRWSGWESSEIITTWKETKH